jgi:hypothetical protein
METYYTYLRWCQDYNERNLIDPTSEEMEWHHTLPQCIFGDIRIGLWLTIKQHAIATALQSLAFGHNCLFGGHLTYLPQWLLDLCWDMFVDAKRQAGSVKGYRHATVGASVQIIQLNKLLHETKNPEGKSVHALATLHTEKEGKTAASRGGESGGRVTGNWPWWVNPLGETTRSPESPGLKWVRGRKYKEP